MSVFLKLGRVTVERPDKFNWTVVTKEGTRYYPTLATAVKRAAISATDLQATDAWKWLTEFQKIVTKLGKIAEVIEKKGAKTDPFSAAPNELKTNEKPGKKPSKRRAPVAPEAEA